MAQVTLDWREVSFQASEVRNWRDFKRVVDLTIHADLLSSHAVYVIRVNRPYSFRYPKAHSPVAYIGKGHAQQRLTSHLNTWIPHLSGTIADLKLTIWYCQPVVRRLGKICGDVEADLIKRFKERYGHLPLRNRNTPNARYAHTYDANEAERVLRPGSGKGYHWAIEPLRSSPFFRSH